MQIPGSVEGVARARILPFLRRLSLLLNRLALAVGLAASAALWITPAADTSNVLKINHFGTGAVAAYSHCIPQGNGDELCDDFVIQYGAAGDTRDGVARSQVGLLFEHYRAFVHPDGTADEFVAELGFSSAVDGAYDKSRLTFARMSGATLDLFDIDPLTGNLTPNGRTATLGPFTWTAASIPYVFGNNGPFGFGLPRHYVDRCVTLLENAHERFTTAHVTGTINGVSVSAYGPAYLPWPGTAPADALGAIFANRFTVIVTTHAPGC